MIGTWSPCHECQERHDLCHSDCEKYLSFRSKKDLENSLRREHISINFALSELHRHSASSRKQRRPK